MCAELIPARSEDVLAEARNLASLPEHDNVVKVLDAGDWNEHFVFIASELCVGGPWRMSPAATPSSPGVRAS